MSKTLPSTLFNALDHEIGSNLEIDAEIPPLAFDSDEDMLYGHKPEEEAEEEGHGYTQSGPTGQPICCLFCDSSGKQIGFHKPFCTKAGPNLDFRECCESANQEDPIPGGEYCGWQNEPCPVISPPSDPPTCSSPDRTEVCGPLASAISWIEYSPGLRLQEYGFKGALLNYSANPPPPDSFSGSDCSCPAGVQAITTGTTPDIQSFLDLKEFRNYHAVFGKIACCDGKIESAWAPAFQQVGFTPEPG